MAWQRYRSTRSDLQPERDGMASEPGKTGRLRVPMELRIDPLTGVQVQVTESRQARPNRPSGDCPFCVGSTEAPEPYLVKAFTNRFPSFPDDRCEVVLYAPDHDARLPDLPLEHVRRVVDLWTERTAVLGARPDLGYVLVFENHGESVGATIAHPHGQIYAYP